jgi:hypothetical protein
MWDFSVGFAVDTHPRHFKATSAMLDIMLPLPGLSPVAGKSVVAQFDRVVGRWASGVARG